MPLHALVVEGDALLAGAHDTRAVATYLIARGFLPFWQAAGGRSIAVDPREPVAVKRGLRLARRLADPLLQSAALDALAGIAQSTGDHAEARERARQRIEFEDRLDLTERLDAHAFFAWESCLVGDFAGAERTTREVVQVIEPARAPTAALHALAWRAFSQAMLGSWDDALVSAAVAEAVWTSLARPAAGYAAHGFLAAAESCAARDDEACAGHWRAVLEATCSAFPPGSFARTPLAVARRDRRRVLDAIARPVALVERPHLIARAVSFCTDAGWPVQRPTLDRLEQAAVVQGLRPLLAEVRRARGMQERDASLLRAAMATALEIGQRPLVARLQLELGRLVGDAATADAGRRELDALGDRTPLTAGTAHSPVGAAG
jgi:hypothetical protein